MKGRPSLYTPELAAAICARLAEGESLRQIGRDEAMPSAETVRRWLLDDSKEDFRVQYVRAREAQADRYFEEILEIADAHEYGEKRTIKADGSVETVEADMIEHRRLRVDARKWVVARMAPKKYGDKLLTEHAGEGGGPVRMVIETGVPRGTED